MRLLTEQERTEITTAIKEAEKQTSCEFVVAEIAQCDDYNSAKFIWGIIIAFVSAFLAYFISNVTVIYFMLIELIGFSVGFFLVSRILLLMRWIIPIGKIESEVQCRALAEFYENGLHKTKEENGILIMLAVFERMVVILGDKGVNTKVTADYWNKMDKKIIAGIKQGKTVSAIAEVIKSCASDLKNYFPVKSDDKNELTDKVITVV
ncbi:MAG: TPM domain-containing protein [Planctomycetota bacterium]|nr:TPM domain-containing protein [Planctomycetota bacterium]MDI6787669.1 TPM domain-containing protein [Planctomycetota bacterium]